MTRPRKTLKTAPAGMRLDAQTHRIPAGGGHGVDVASQRADYLDERCLAFLDARFARDLTTRPSALDVACGQGGQAIRLAAAGCRVTAVDIQDHAADIRRAASYHRVRQPPIFLQADLRALPAVLPEAPFDALICQRALHYIRYAEAVAAVASWRRHLAPGARVFVSASGLSSELGRGYPHAERPVAERFACLAPDMAERHDIRPAVCLYEASDMVELLHAAGLGVAEVFVSPFGNVKAVALV